MIISTPIGYFEIKEFQLQAVECAETIGSKRMFIEQVTVHILNCISFYGWFERSDLGVTEDTVCVWRVKQKTIANIKIS